MSLIDEFRSLHSRCHPPCLVSRCSKEGCDLPIRESGRFVCVDADHCAAFPPQEKRPDYVILDSARPRWVVVEMKSRTVKPDDIVSQFKATVSILANDPRFALNVTLLVPVVLYQRIHSQDHKVLQHRRVLFQGRAYPIRTCRCGTPLENILKS